MLDILKDFSKHLAQKGWLSITNIAMDERSPEMMKATISLVQKIAPDLGISLADNHKSYKEYPFIKDLCVKHGAVVEEADLKYRKENGLNTTYYSYCGTKFPNQFTFSLPAEAVYAAWYAKAFNKELEERGFVLYNKDAGASPDRLIVDEKKGIEIKCPFVRANHLKHLKLSNAKELKAEFPNHYWQIMHNLLCIDYESWDFVSFDPRYREDLKLFALEVKRNDEDCKLLEQRLSEAIEIKNNILKSIV